MESPPPPPPTVFTGYLPSSTPKKKLNRNKHVWTLHYCGYVLDRAWYLEQSAARFGAEGVSEFSQRLRFFYSLIMDSGLSGRATLKNVKLHRDSGLCIALASNASERSTKLPPQAKIDKLKALLGTDEPPKWYEYDG
jgi:hypothetical protein